MPTSIPAHILPVVFGADAVSAYDDGETDMDTLLDLGEVEQFGFSLKRDMTMFIRGMLAAIGKSDYMIALDLSDPSAPTTTEQPAEGDEKFPSTILVETEGEASELTYEQHKLIAIRALTVGAFDHPCLMAYGPLTGNLATDIDTILTTNLEG